MPSLTSTSFADRALQRNWPAESAAAKAKAAKDTRMTTSCVYCALEHEHDRTVRVLAAEGCTPLGERLCLTHLIGWWRGCVAAGANRAREIVTVKEQPQPGAAPERLRDGERWALANQQDEFHVQCYRCKRAMIITRDRYLNHRRYYCCYGCWTASTGGVCTCPPLTREQLPIEEL